ncbi:MAG: thioredoxin [Bacteroidetes bacterium HGW-Bacteroidetes-1]|jgi:thioredoxin-related protein|nr:MAG: thioredoxin [Bacteroidetes bacterium HGW-Bacteroidetes-1]
MKSILTIAVGIIMMVLVAAQIPGSENENAGTSAIQFKSGSWNEVLALAKKENKPVFLDISASWCGYCKRMKANVFTDVEVAKYYNSNFINVAVDGEKGEGIDLAKKYGVKGYPTFVFLNPDGSLAYQTSGYHNPEKFLELGKNVVNK